MDGDAVDGDSKAGEVTGMILSGDARTLWDAALALNRAREGASDLPPLLFLTDPARTHRPWETAARLPKGAAVIYRHFGDGNREVVAQRLREVTQERGVRLLVGLDVDLARSCGADGVHLPERALGEVLAIRAEHPHWLLTGAVHSLEAATAARGLDALILSPIFPAGGASAAKTALGAEILADAALHAACPVYALGGVNAATVTRLTGSGAAGFAGVEAIRAAFD